MIGAKCKTMFLDNEIDLVKTVEVDCEWKVQARNLCAAPIDWSCSGICKSLETMEEVHQR